GGTSTDSDVRGLRGVEAASVVAVQAAFIAGPVTGAGLWIGAAAILEVADLIREGDVVRVRCPWHARVLAGRAVHRMEVPWGLRTGGSAWSVVDCGEAIGAASRHRSGLPRRRVVERDPQST